MSELLPRTSLQSRATAFTLVELLVVIGVVALLLSLLLPALARARSVSRAITCASQLREMGNGMILYSHDYNGWIPRTHYSLPGIR
jgi:type II secretory pathway pseudopilin PulG